MSLFKIDSKSKLRILQIEAHGDKIVRQAGIFTGRLVVTEKKCSPKNVGRSNETSGDDQAVLEVASEKAKKIREGYVAVPLEVRGEAAIRAYVVANSLDIPKCMLAKDYNARYFQEGQPYLVSSKLDGMRCMAVINEKGVTLYSRGRKEIHTMQHLKNALTPLCAVVDSEVILDGELYYHDRSADNFQEIMKAIKKYRKGISELVEYHVYELIDEKLPASSRKTIIADSVERANNESIIYVDQVRATSMKVVREIHALHLELGYEGTMLKGEDSMYRQGVRSSDLLKLKDFIEEDFEVVDIVPMDFNPIYGKAVVRMPSGKTFNATPKMSYALREQLLTDKDKWIGGIATVKYFGRTDAGLPRIASLKCITVKGDLEDFRIGTK